MKITTVLFDLDGTLLPMEQENFIKVYFGALAKKLEPYGFEPKKLFGSIWAGTEAMVRNDGTRYNVDAFWEVMENVYGEGMRARYEHVFDEFYALDFDREVSVSCGFDESAARVVKALKQMGYRVALATNPLFPEVATKSRIRWAGLEPDDFELFTAYENSRYCKPNLDYYREVTSRLGIEPESCLMVGNDVGEDMITQDLGMKVFLVTRNIINKKGEDISVYPHGVLEDVLKYIKRING